MMKWALIVLFVSAVAAQNYEESFTIFIDLDDFHVTQAGNHEFQSAETIGEHNNVVLHLSEDEVRYHQKLHDTHACEAPAEVHEVVSFIQEKMYEAPVAPNFIDDVITSNYAPSANLWEKLKAQPKGQMPTGQMPMPNFNNMWGMPFPSVNHGQMPSQLSLESMFQAPAQFPAMKPAAAALAPAKAAPVAAAPVQTLSAPAATAVAPTPVEDEETAMTRFREAYRAYKLFNHAVEGLGEYATPASAALAGQSATQATAQTAPKSWYEGLIDDDDRRLMGMLNGGHKSSPAMGMFSDILGSSAGSSAGVAPTASFDAEINNIVDAAVKSVFTPSSLDQQLVDQPTEEVQEKRHHHHHHHHHDDEIAAPAVEERKDDLSESDKDALTSLLAKLTAHDKTGKLKAAIQEALSADEPAVAIKAAPVVAEAPKVDETPTPDNHAKVDVIAPKMVIPATGASRPAAPSMVSHIEKAPSAMDFIPESVYSLKDVPFKESLPEIIKHVPKRILIPRMEEPGPVIGGSSRPVHIQIPTSDLEMKTATRPAAPSQMGLSISSEITTQVDTANTADVSVKASSIASANDEALTQPEVVIF